VRDGEYPSIEVPLETAWTFWYDKKTSDRKESDQYMEGLRQLGSFNTIEGFYRHYTYLLRPSEFPRDHNILLFRKGYKPMWEEFPEGGCWIIRIKRKVSQSYVNHMWENLLLACVGEAFEMPDVVGCVLSTRLKDDVLSVWNLSNRDSQARFRIGEKLKEVLDLDMNALIQYKDHMQSLQDYSTYRNAKNYMFAPSPSVTPQQASLDTPFHTHQDSFLADQDLDQGMLPPAAIDTMLPPAAVDSDGFGFTDAGVPMRSAHTSREHLSSSLPSQRQHSPMLSASAAPWSPATSVTKSPALSAAAPPWSPASLNPTKAPPSTGETNIMSSGARMPTVLPGRSPPLSPAATPWYPPSLSSDPGIQAATELDEKEKHSRASISAPDGGIHGKPKETFSNSPEKDAPKSWAAVVAGKVSAKPQPRSR